MTRHLCRFLDQVANRWIFNPPTQTFHPGLLFLGAEFRSCPRGILLPCGRPPLPADHVENLTGLFGCGLRVFFKGEVTPFTSKMNLHEELPRFGFHPEGLFPIRQLVAANSTCPGFSLFGAALRNCKKTASCNLLAILGVPDCSRVFCHVPKLSPANPHCKGFRGLLVGTFRNNTAQDKTT